MPYIQKEIKLMRTLKRRHGAKKGNRIYHAMLNSREHEENFGARSKRERGKPESQKARKPDNQQKRKTKPRQRRARKGGCK